MNRRRMIELAAFLSMMAGLFVAVLVADAFADAMERRVDNSNMVMDECNCIIEQFDDEIAPPEDPHESEKIEAALDWHYIDGCELTAYCSCVECCGKSDGITATGTIAQEGVTIAVDPDVIPLGSWVEINGHQYHAEDIGGAINGAHIDIYFDSHDAAWDFGHRYADVRWYMENMKE